jgi:thiamine-monophosphate kinase
MGVKRLASIGERKAIELISSLLSQGNVAVGIGDDCAALDLGEDYLLVTTDMMTVRTHTPQATPAQIGWHLIAINLSDIASKGGRPLGIVTALGLPRETPISFIKQLAKGMDRCARTFGTSVIGGDTKESCEITLTGTAFGLVKKDAFMPRSGARIGDLVAVTGRLGGAAAGYQALRRGLKVPQAVKALLEPWPRVREGMVLAKAHVATSCIDISDGLSTSLYHLAGASKVGFSISYEMLPVHEAIQKVRFPTERAIQNAVMHFGGEYELLMTLDPGNLLKASKALKRLGTELTVIGVVTRSKILIEKDGKAQPLENKGWEHFRTH